MDESTQDSLALPKGDKGDTGNTILTGNTIAYTTTTQAGTPGTTVETTLATVTINPATYGVMSKDGDEIWIRAELQTGANANGKTVKIYFGATAIISRTTSLNGGLIFIDAKVARKTQVTQTGSANMLLDVGLNLINASSPVENLFFPFVVKVTGTNAVATANDIIINKFTVYSLKNL